ncbi:MAG: NYN domain-containing protein [Actinomycetota bacterium]|jgi:predicted RNA-binding protein with PIN domain|nr:NYN domain-containing protein [Actinomycetota bacterium]
MRWIIDGMNVIGSRPDGWWRDRAAARRRLLREVAGVLDRLEAADPHSGTAPCEPELGPRDGTVVVVVFDGRHRADEVAAGAEAGLEVVFAPGGPNAADRVIAVLVRDAPRPVRTVVVTSDRALADQVRAIGATVVGPRELRALMATTSAAPLPNKQLGQGRTKRE